VGRYFRRSAAFGAGNILLLSQGEGGLCTEDKLLPTDSTIRRKCSYKKGSTGIDEFAIIS
jgi:hypothetical protein